MSEVDVIVPCHGYGRFLQECVESVLVQEGVGVRVLVLDDASPDRTAEVGAGLAARDGRVLYRRHAANRGHIATYNEGLGWASSEYMLLLDADDVLTPGALLRATRLMDDHPGAGMCYGRARVTRDPGSEPFGVGQDYAWRVVGGSEFIEGFCATGLNSVFQPTAVVRTRVQKEVGGYLPELPHTGDMQMWLRFAARGEIGILDAEQAFYRVHATNMTAQYQGIADLRQLKKCFELFFADCENRVADRGRLHALAMRRVAEHALRHARRNFKAGEIDRCRELLAFALSCCPSVSSEPACQWLRKRIEAPPAKRRVLQRVIDRIRGKVPR